MASDNVLSSFDENIRIDVTTQQSNHQRVYVSIRHFSGLLYQKKEIVAMKQNL